MVRRFYSYKLINKYTNQVKYYLYLKSILFLTEPKIKLETGNTSSTLGIIIARISHITLANGLHMPQNITRCITIYSAYVSVLALVGHL